MLQKKTFNVLTNEETFTDLTADEIAQMELAKAEAIAFAETQATKQAGRQAVLEKLGLTAKDIAALSL